MKAIFAIAVFMLAATSAWAQNETWQVGDSAGVANGVVGVQKLITNTIQTGKLLVVEHVSARISVNGASAVTSGLNLVRFSAQGLEDNLTCVKMGQKTTAAVGYFSCSTQTKIYVPAGSRLQVSLYLATEAANAVGWSYAIFASGHYEKVQ